MAIEETDSESWITMQRHLSKASRAERPDPKTASFSDLATQLITCDYRGREFKAEVLNELIKRAQRGEFPEFPRPTFLNDNTGNPIFENDIIEFVSYVDWDDPGERVQGVVKWCQRKGSFAVYCTPQSFGSNGIALEACTDELGNHSITKCTRLGNIFTNPDLLPVAFQLPILKEPV